MNRSGPGLIEAVIESWRLVIGNAAPLARIAAIPFLLFIALNRLEAAFEPEGLAVLPWTLLFTILAAGPAVMLLMPWYRRLLAAGDPAMASRPATWWSVVLMLRWVGLDVMFFVAMTPVMAMLIQVMAVDNGAAPPGEIILIHYAAVFICSYLFYGRLGLALPAAAAESDHSYRQAWATTGGIGWRIGLAIVFFALALELPIAMLQQPLAVENATVAMQYLHAALGALFRVVNELLGAAVLAQYYLAQKAGPWEDED